MAKNKEEIEQPGFEDMSLFDEIVDKFHNPEDPEIIDPVVKKKVEVPQEDEEEEIENPDLQPEVNDEEEEQDDNLETVSDDEEQTSLFTPYAKFLVEEGILSTLDLNKFDGTAAGLKKAQMDEINYYVERYKENLPVEVKRLLNGYEAGVPFDEMLQISSDRIRYDNIKEDSLKSDTELQKALVKDYLDKTTRLSDTMKSKMIAQWEDTMELEAQSKLALTELKEYQNTLEQEAIQRQLEEQKQIEKERIDSLARLDKHISSTEEVIPGLKINQVLKDKIKNNLTVPVAYDEYGNPMNKVGKYMAENPIEGEFILHYIFEATNGFKDWSLFGRVGKSQALKDLENQAKAFDGKSQGNQKTNNKSTKNSDLLSSINSLLK